MPRQKKRRERHRVGETERVPFSQIKSGQQVSGYYGAALEALRQYNRGERMTGLGRPASTRQEAQGYNVAREYIENHPYVSTDAGLAAFDAKFQAKVGNFALPTEGFEAPGRPRPPSHGNELAGVPGYTPPAGYVGSEADARFSGLPEIPDTIATMRRERKSIIPPGAPPGLGASIPRAGIPQRLEKTFQTRSQQPELGFPVQRLGGPRRNRSRRPRYRV